MKKRKNSNSTPRLRHSRDSERGVTLYLVAASILLLLGLAGLAIDLANLYVARSQAQRAADAAALAGATAFVTSGYTSGGTDRFTAGGDATTQALAVGRQNEVGGRAPAVNINFLNLDVQANPRITVSVAQRIPLLFMKVFGQRDSVVSTSATAEAYNPSGEATGLTFCTGCLKPMMIANCDPAPGHATIPNPSPGCPSHQAFIDGTTGQIGSPQRYDDGGVVGEPIILQYASNPTPPLIPTGVFWYGVSIDGSPDPFVWANNITTCNAALHTCNDTLQTINLQATGMIPVPETLAVDDLIHATTPGPFSGQDTIAVPSVFGPNLPYSIFGGRNNPNFPVIGQPITQSDSIATFPIYDGHTVLPGNVGVESLTVIGFMQVFIQSVDIATGNITANILNISGCGTNGNAGTCGGTYGSGGSGPAGVISGGGSSAVPVRLINPR